MQKFFLFALSPFVFFFMNSCIVAVVDYSGSSGIRPMEEFHKTVSLNSGGTLYLENINGDIEILGWDRNEVEIFADKMISRSYSRKIRWQPIGRLVPKIDYDKFEDFIKVKTIPVSTDKERTVVNYYLNVPHSINLKDIIGRNGDILISDLYGEAFIDLRNGNIKVENFSGSLTASVFKGSVEASLMDLRGEDEIRISIKEGDIILYLQAEVNAKIEASTQNGNIFSDFDLKEPLPAEKVTAQIGENGALISLSSLNGDIRIKKL